MSEYYRTGSFLRLSAEFVDEIRKKYHYNENDANILKKVAVDIRNCIKDQEGLELCYGSEYVDAAFSLGSRVDLLLDRYAAGSFSLEQLAAEHILSELMMDEYAEIAERIEEKTGRFTGTFHFWGSEEDYPIESLKIMVESLEYLKLSCTPEYFLRPSKSVVFRVELSQEKHEAFGGNEHKPNVDVCTDCMLNKTGRCKKDKE